MEGRGALVLGASEGAEGRRLAVSLATPEKLRTLRRKLYTKAKREMIGTCTGSWVWSGCGRGRRVALECHV